MKCFNFNEIQDQFSREMENRNYAQNTINAYTKWLEIFIAFSRNTDLSPQERICRFLNQYKGIEQVKQAYYAIKAFYKLVLKIPCPYKLEKVRVLHRKPELMSKREIDLLLNTISNNKHRLMIALMYASGLRVSEVVHIKVKDLHLNELTLSVKQGKQNKDRITVISPKLKEPLEALISSKDQNDFLFCSQKGKPYQKRTLQAIFYKARDKSGLSPAFHCHSLRHSFATHIIESGVAVENVQELLGHKTSRTTMIYIHLADPAAKRVESPF